MDANEQNEEDRSAADPDTDLPPLVLHMDINKTLIICDPVSGVDTDAMVNSLLSECSWGVVDTPTPPPDGQQLPPRSWRLLSPEPSATPPAVGLCNDDGVAIMTYNEFLEDVLQVDKPTKKRLKGGFTHTGAVGEALRPWHGKVLAALQIPVEQRAAAGQAVPKLERGQYYMLPSFFRLVSHLEAQEREFSLVFRTFGTDTADVAQEWNCFCEGRHPLFPLALPERTRERRLELPRDSGAIYRTDGDEGGGVHLAMVSEATKLVTLTHGLPAIHARVMTHLRGEQGDGVRRRSRSLALQDDYVYWAKHGESDDSGKVLIVDDPAGGSAAPRQIFFDDNIERLRPHIVDARDLRTGKPLTFHGDGGTHGRQLVKVDPLQAVLDVDYFVRALHAAEERM